MNISWLYVLVMSRTRFRVNPHFIVACQGTPCSKQGRNLKVKWRQLDSSLVVLGSSPVAEYLLHFLKGRYDICQLHLLLCVLGKRNYERITNMHFNWFGEKLSFFLIYSFFISPGDILGSLRVRLWPMGKRCP